MMEALWVKLTRVDWTSLLSTHGVTVLKIAAIAIIARLLLGAGHRFIEQYSRKKTNKAQTLSPLLKQLWRYLVLFLAAMLILDQFNIKLTPILATAGVAGVAIGFGAQRLVRDLITGFFLLLEDQYSVGDYITVGSFSGVVEELGLRVTRLRDFNGDLHIIPNGNIDNVTNHARGNSRARVDVGVPYEADLDRVIGILQELSSELAAKLPEIIEGPEVLGVVELSNSQAIVRIQAQTTPLQHWQVEREIRRAIKNRLDREGISLPYPRYVIYQQGSNREEKPEGNS
ncbi:MAG TPA: mechanosensitive ion channel family protein [Firmicutes bacterium]|nr:mechanosensitive ion channel family protein [Bacillota bacterium]